ncbi:hypothetical protein, conserved [Eimeria necatrix]|uniref:Uncharacterized protein n=1 Tax=Eimeria necatrix TaxID=51315 RepID=U6MQN0_9EIME|nr:hypothetical protein, conserved [Eimeria necatrix]CDJ63965.1 hypothetical protein, conserved [Eimeria necatrix]
MFVTASIQAGEVAWPQAVELVAKTGDSQLLERLKAELSKDKESSIGRLDSLRR